MKYFQRKQVRLHEEDKNARNQNDFEHFHKKKKLKTKEKEKTTLNTFTHRHIHLYLRAFLQSRHHPNPMTPCKSSFVLLLR